MSYAAARCPTCGTPLVVREGRTWLPHLSWCRWAPRPRPPVVALPARETRPDPDNTDPDPALEETPDARR